MPSSYTIPVLHKTFMVLNCLSKHNEGLSLSDIVKKLELPKSTVFKILFTLEQEHIVKKENDCFFLGSMLIHYGLHTLSQRDLVPVAKPYLMKLMKETGETAHLAVPVGRQSMMLDVIQSVRHIIFSSPVGSLFPLYCTSHGKIILAFTKEFTLDEYLEKTELVKRTENTITSVDELKREIEKIKTQGYAMDDIEFADDIRCCAAPVRDSDGLLMGALGITATTITFGKDRFEEISKIVMDTAEQISKEMGYTC